MSADFKLDKKAIDKIAQDLVKDTIRKAQPEFDRMSRQCSGKPVNEVKRKVEAALRKYGLEADRGRVDEYAEVIANGDRIVLKQ